jgi:hypothetical protein
MFWGWTVCPGAVVEHKNCTIALFFNPYNGKYLADQDFKDTFLNQVEKVRRYCTWCLNAT